MKTIYLVACTKRKAPGELEARDKYMASPWFRAARALAEAKGDAWYILSALHGVLDPKDIIGDYNKSLARMTARERRDWAAWVLNTMAWCLPDEPRPCTVVILAGRLYRQHLCAGLQEYHCEIETPLAHIPGVGRQQKWMKQQLESQD